MVKGLLIALALVTALAHTVVGTVDTLLPLLAADLPPMVKATFHACWHMVSLLLIWSVYRFWKGGTVAAQLGLLWILAGVAFLVAGWVEGGPGGLLVAPQWALLIPVGMLAFGMNRAERSGP